MNERHATLAHRVSATHAGHNPPVCDTAATRPSSKITLRRLVIIIIITRRLEYSGVDLLWLAGCTLVRNIIDMTHITCHRDARHCYKQQLGKRLEKVSFHLMQIEKRHLLSTSASFASLGSYSNAFTILTDHSRISY